MEKFNKLPSGNWNVRKYDYTDANGKRHYKSFTAATKGEIKLMIAKWKTDRTKDRNASISLSEAVERYISMKESVLSPATVRSYKSMHKLYFTDEGIGSVKVDKLKKETVQVWISNISAEKSSKTVRNVYGLLSAACDMFAPDLDLKGVTLPKKQKAQLYCPSEQDVQILLDYVRRQGDKPMELCILLAALGPMRRSEILALTQEDIKSCTITISKALVKNSDGVYVVKEPKTYSGYRSIEYPQFVIDLIDRKSDRLVDVTPDWITTKFHNYVLAAGLPEFRFHDLRHFGATTLLARMSQRLVQDRGGWGSNAVMNSVYNNVIDLEKKRQTADVLEYFEKFK